MLTAGPGIPQATIIDNPMILFVETKYTVNKESCFSDDYELVSIQALNVSTVLSCSNPYIYENLLQSIKVSNSVPRYTICRGSMIPTFAPPVA